MDSFLQCLGRRPRITFLHRLPVDDTRQAVTAVVDTLFIADKDGMELRLALDGITRMNDCKQNFARAVSEALRKSIETARPMVDALRAIYEKWFTSLMTLGTSSRTTRSCAHLLRWEYWSYYPDGLSKHWGLQKAGFWKMRDARDNKIMEILMLVYVFLQHVGNRSMRDSFPRAPYSLSFDDLT